MSDDLDALAYDLAEFEVEKKPVQRPAIEERVIAGFEDIQRFVEQNKHAPQHDAENDIFERLYAVRLQRLANNSEYRSLLEPTDYQDLLSGIETVSDDDDIDLDALASDLEDLENTASSISELRHVRSSAEKQAAEEIANREICEDFDNFKSRFDQVQADLKTNIRTSRAIRKNAGFLKTDIKEHEFFILGGLTLYVAEVGPPIKAPNGASDARLRVIYSNGTESNILLRSLQRAIYKDETSRIISDPSCAGPLFSDSLIEGDEASGTIYVLRSKSGLPIVEQNRDLLHKIGVTGGSIEKRISNAKQDPTFLMADVEVITTYELFNINRVKLENLLHRIFENARLNIEIQDRFGHPVTPREWFLVPIFAVDEAVNRIKDGTIGNVRYDPHEAEFSDIRN